MTIVFLCSVSCVYYWAGDEIICTAVNSERKAIALPAETSDCFAAISNGNEFLRANGGGVLEFPQRRIRLSKCLHLHSGIEYRGKLRTVLCNHTDAHIGPILISNMTVEGNKIRHGSKPQSNVKLHSLVIEQTACTSQSSHCVFVQNGIDWVVTDVYVKGAKHEGFAGAFLRGRFTRLIAEECGIGSPHRQNSGAGINIGGHGNQLVDCTTYRCEQGFEGGGNGNLYLRCRALKGKRRSPYSGAPNVGFHFSSSGTGNCRLMMIDCEAEGYAGALGYGNVLGRAGGFVLTRFHSNECATGITIIGSLSTNKNPGAVPREFDFPADEPSFVSSVRLNFPRASFSEPAIKFYHGTQVEDAQYCKRDTYIRDVVATYNTYADPTLAIRAPLMVNGYWSGQIEFDDIVLKGLDAAPQRGHFDLDHAAKNRWPGSSKNVILRKARAFKKDGSEYHFLERRWSVPH